MRLYYSRDHVGLGGEGLTGIEQRQLSHQPKTAKVKKAPPSSYNYASVLGDEEVHLGVCMMYSSLNCGAYKEVPLNCERTRF